MKEKFLAVIQTAVLFGSPLALAQSQPLSGDYIANQNTCSYLVEISGGPHPGSVIHIEATSQSFTLSLNAGSVELEELSSDIVGHFSEPGEGGVVDYDGRYSDNGNHFLATQTEEAGPLQGPITSVSHPIEATKTDGGVNLVFNGTTSCYLTNNH